MSIRWDKRNKRWRFEFDRYVQGRRFRVSRLLPQGWNQAKADAFDRTEAGRLYGVATGVEDNDPLIESAIKLYLADKADLKSHASASQHLAAINPAITGKRMSQLAEVAAEITLKRASLKDKDKALSDATIRQRLALLKAACRWAWKKHGLTKTDPTGQMQLPAVRNERHVYASRQEVGRLVKRADRRDVRVMILLAFYTGMRLGELKRAYPEGGALILEDTKNGDRRAVPVHPRVVRLLKHMPLSTPKSTLQRGFERARDKAGLPHVHIHDLRHSTASEMVNAGVDLFTVGVVLGHRDPRSTKRYAHLKHATLADAIGKVGQKVPHTKPSAGQEKGHPKAA